MRNLLLAATLLAGLVHAADDPAIPYASLAERLLPFGASVKDRDIVVVTTDGVKHKGRTLRLGEDGVRLFAPKSVGAFYPKERIARIEIDRGTREFRRIGGDAKDIVEHTGHVCTLRSETDRNEPIECVIGGPIVAAATTARMGINMPFYFIGGVIDVLTPAEVYRIAP